MPISREEWDQGLINLALPIAGLLARLPDLAFTVEEVRQLLSQTEAREITVEEVEQALDALESSARVHRKEIRGQQWYTIAQRRLGFLRE